QNGQIRDRLAAVGEHHCEIGGDPARVMAGAALSCASGDQASSCSEMASPFCYACCKSVISACYLVV
ncbi:hypothetical protein ACFVYE_46680, partial [Streptomyces sp. NPDC058239]|uniref:hypothetical protein n=1 Tax=Streptomyces sp. NPDC058239 TaxID=3346395 RepID=UPI0036ED69F9